jgi:hypothetical protein
VRRERDRQRGEEENMHTVSWMSGDSESLWGPLSHPYFTLPNALGGERLEFKKAET